MKLLAFSDLHANLTALKRLEATIAKEKPDILINLGDFTVFEQNIEAVCAKLARLHKRQIVLHGNHEEEGTVALMCKRFGWRFGHQQLIAADGLLFVGYGGGGFSYDEPEFARWARKNERVITAAKKVVLLTHQPPYGTVLDHLWGDHVGNRTFTQFIKKHGNVALALSGHIHETAGKSGKLHKTALVNPGPLGTVLTV